MTVIFNLKQGRSVFSLIAQILYGEFYQGIQGAATNEEYTEFFQQFTLYSE